MLARELAGWSAGVFAAGSAGVSEASPRFSRLPRPKKFARKLVAAELARPRPAGGGVVVSGGGGGGGVSIS